jgi:hypothetical protein
MKFTLICEDENRMVGITHDELDYLPDVMDMLLNFLQAVGYTYVEKLGVVKANGDEAWTE